MIPEIGHFALILALCLALLQAIFPLVGSFQGKIAWLEWSRPLAWGQWLFISIAFFALGYAFITNDFSVQYVAENSNTHLPWVYRFCAIWGAHEGSLLLWVFFLSLWGAIFASLSRRLPLITRAQILSILALIAIGFLLFLLFTSNPFIRLLPKYPQEGRDLNPLLQDPGLVSHPPMLYMGYVGFAVTFAFAMTALIQGRLDQTWAKHVRPWATAAWCFLTLGVVLGSWWAYRELGWGGFWFWDPVENASFMPWLVGTALIHTLAVNEKQSAFKIWTVLLAIAVFALSLLGTFLVRSGVLISVHAFAVDPKRGIFILAFLTLVIGGALTLYAIRGKTLKHNHAFSLLSREACLLTNTVVFFVAMLTVLLGTVYPILMSALGWGKISVGAPYFNAVFFPLIMPLWALMGVAPYVRWEKSSKNTHLNRLWTSAVISLFLTIIAVYLFSQHLESYTLVGSYLGIWLLTSSLQSIWHNKISLRQSGMIISHVGVAITTIGIIFASTQSLERDVRIDLHDSVKVGQYRFQLDSIHSIQGPNYHGAEAEVNVYKGQQFIKTMYPQQRLFDASQMALPKTAIDPGLFKDIYVALGQPIGQTSWTLRIYIKPFVRWIWFGGILIALGGLFVIFNAIRQRWRQS